MARGITLQPDPRDRSASEPKESEREDGVGTNQENPFCRVGVTCGQSGKKHGDEQRVLDRPRGKEKWQTGHHCDTSHEKQPSSCRPGADGRDEQREPCEGDAERMGKQAG